ncbi:hypothetical protein BDR07DRAFT_1457894 [Suillus spraguei]|nr:hypothetical protein BDR07DRAFT_1457894 [Suillus spraguei]
MIEIGQSRELTSRVLLLLAKDLFIHQNPSEGAIWDLVHDISVDAKLLVIEFLAHLFGENFWLKGGEEAKKAFQHAYINFLHWVPMTEFISPPVPRDLELNQITRMHKTIQCISDLPYITLLLDLNVDLDAQLDVKFSQRTPHHPNTDQCLQIYASGMSVDTFPFLHRYPNVAMQLQEILSQKKEASPKTTFQAIVKFGSTSRPYNLWWEDHQASGMIFSEGNVQ